MNQHLSNPHTSEARNYIHQRLIVDYYNNDKLIAEGVVNLINLLKIHNPERILHLLDTNKSNIHFYGNKNNFLKNKKGEIGKKVRDGFQYDSQNNKYFLTVDKIKEMLKKFS